MKRAILSILACIVVLAGGAGLWFLMDHLKPEPPRVETTKRLPLVRVQVAKRSNRRIDVTTQGTVTPRTEIRLVAQVAGAVTKVSPALVNGGFFEKDDVLVQLDARDYQFEVTRAKAQVAQAKLRVTRELAEAEVARKEWEALGKGSPSPLTVREPQVLEAKAAQRAAEATLHKAELALERTTIKAPFAGRVRMKGVDVGQFVAIGTSMATVYAVDYVEVRLPLHDSKLRYLDLPLSFRNGEGSHHNPTVTLTATFGGQRHEWRGTIVRTEGEIDPKSRMVHAVAKVDDPYGRKGDKGPVPLAVGMFVEAKVHGREFPNVIEIPRAALREGNHVLVVDANGAMFRRDVGVLFTDADTVILAQGVQVDERVCLSPLAIVFDGMKVEVRDEAAEGQARK